LLLLFDRRDKAAPMREHRHGTVPSKGAHLVWERECLELRQRAASHVHRMDRQ